MPRLAPRIRRAVKRSAHRKVIAAGLLVSVLTGCQASVLAGTDSPPAASPLSPTPSIPSCLQPASSPSSILAASSQRPTESIAPEPVTLEQLLVDASRSAGLSTDVETFVMRWDSMAALPVSDLVLEQDRTPDGHLFYSASFALPGQPTIQIAIAESSRIQFGLFLWTTPSSPDWTSVRPLVELTTAASLCVSMAEARELVARVLPMDDVTTPAHRSATYGDARIEVLIAQGPVVTAEHLAFVISRQ